MTYICLALIALLAYREYTARQERRELITRITHPHVLPSPATHDDGPTYVPFDDDEAFHDAQREALNGR